MRREQQFSPFFCFEWCLLKSASDVSFLTNCVLTGLLKTTMSIRIQYQTVIHTLILFSLQQRKRYSKKKQKDWEHPPTASVLFLKRTTEGKMSLWGTQDTPNSSVDQYKNNNPSIYITTHDIYPSLGLCRPEHNLPSPSPSRRHSPTSHARGHIIHISCLTKCANNKSSYPPVLVVKSASQGPLFD